MRTIDNPTWNATQLMGLQHILQIKPVHTLILPIRLLNLLEYSSQNLAFLMTHYVSVVMRKELL
jgi:hypothetical protein